MPAVRPPEPARSAPLPVATTADAGPTVTTATIVPAAETYAGPDLVAAWEELPAGLLRVVDGRVVDPNLTFCRMLGYALADWGPSGFDVARIVAAGSLPALGRALAGQERVSLAADLRRKDGSLLPVLLRVAPGPDGAGQ